MGSRWPPLFTTENQACFRECIEKERKDGRKLTDDAPTRSVEPASTDRYKLVAPANRPFLQGVPVQATSVAAALALQKSGGVFPPPQLTTSSKLFSQFSTPNLFEHMRMPIQTQTHADACTNMGLSTSWHGRPLVMSRGGVSENFLSHSHSEPRGIFNSYLQQSTASQAIPAVPLMPWNLGFNAILPSPEFARAP